MRPWMNLIIILILIIVSYNQNKTIRLQNEILKDNLLVARIKPKIEKSKYKRGSNKHLRKLLKETMGTPSGHHSITGIEGEKVTMYTKKAYVDGYHIEPAPTSYLNKNDKRIRASICDVDECKGERRIDVADIWIFNETIGEWERDKFWPKEKELLLTEIDGGE